MMLVYLERAVVDLEWMRDYFGRVFPEGRKRARERYRAAIVRLMASPEIGHRTDVAAVRELLITGPRFPSFTGSLRIGLKSFGSGTTGPIRVLAAPTEKSKGPAPLGPGLLRVLCGGLGAGGRRPGIRAGRSCAARA